LIAGLNSEVLNLNMVFLVKKNSNNPYTKLRRNWGEKVQTWQLVKRRTDKIEEKTNTPNCKEIKGD
jgi:hypothetical protein